MSTRTETSTWTSGGPCACCGGGTPNPVICDSGCECPAGMPTRLKVTFAGLDTGGESPCADCGLLNGTHTLEWNSGAVAWQWTGSSETLNMEMICSGGYLVLNINACGGDSTSYKTNVIDCTGSNVLSLDSLGFGCNETMPATVTIEPDGAVSGGCPVIVPCCVEPVLSNLTLTVVATDTSCSGLNGATIPLVWDGSTYWAGSGTFNGMEITFWLRCTTPDWELTVGTQFPPTGCTDVNANISYATSASCGPVSLNFDPWDDGNGGNLITGSSCTCVILSATVTE